MPRLYILSGPDLGKSFDVEDGATIGRKAECAVYLRDASVSRHHARLERAADGWKIVDTQSRNGVSVRGDASACGSAVIGVRVGAGAGVGAGVGAGAAATGCGGGGGAMVTTAGGLTSSVARDG